MIVERIVIRKTKKRRIKVTMGTTMWRMLLRDELTVVA